jgi:hypothetical protein
MAADLLGFIGGVRCHGCFTWSDAIDEIACVPGGDWRPVRREHVAACRLCSSKMIMFLRRRWSAPLGDGQTWWTVRYAPGDPRTLASGVASWRHRTVKPPCRPSRPSRGASPIDH